MRSAIFRSIGAQFRVAVYLFISFYVIALPIGIYCLLKTPLGIEGKSLVIYRILFQLLNKLQYNSAIPFTVLFDTETF